MQIGKTSGSGFAFWRHGNEMTFQGKLAASNNLIAHANTTWRRGLQKGIHASSREIPQTSNLKFNQTALCGM